MTSDCKTEAWDLDSKLTAPDRLPLRQWGANNVYLLVLSSWKVNIAETPIALMGL